MFLLTSIPVFLGHLELGGKLGMRTQEAQMWSPTTPPLGAGSRRAELEVTQAEI